MYSHEGTGRELDGWVLHKTSAEMLQCRWIHYKTNIELNGNEPKLSTHQFQQRRLRLAGHSHRSTKEPVSQLITWSPKHGRRNRGRQKLI